MRINEVTSTGKDDYNPSEKFYVDFTTDPAKPVVMVGQKTADGRFRLPLSPKDGVDKVSSQLLNSEGFRRVWLESISVKVLGAISGQKALVSPEGFAKLKADEATKQRKHADAGQAGADGGGGIGMGFGTQHPLAEEPYKFEPYAGTTNQATNGKPGEDKMAQAAASSGGTNMGDKPWGKSGDPEKDIGPETGKLRGKTGDPEKDIGAPAELTTALTQLKNILKKYNVTTESRNNLKRRMISENLHEFSPAEQIRIFTILVENKPEQLNEFIRPLIKGLSRMFRVGSGATAGARTAARTTAQSLARRSLANRARNPIRAALPKIGGAALTGWGAYEGAKALWDWWSEEPVKPEEQPGGGVGGFDGGGAGGDAGGGGVAQAIQAGVLSKEDVDTIKKQLPVLVRHFGLTTTSDDLKVDIKATIDGIEDLKDKAMSGQLPAIAGAVGAVGAAGAVGGQTGSNIGPDSDPEDPKTWPPGVKAAPDFGYLDSTGMWIPTPFNIRAETGVWQDPPKGSPANLTGIPHNKYTPFQLKLEKMRWKNAYNNGSLIEQSKIIPLPGGAPEIPGYKRVDPGQFSTSTGAQIGPSNIHWAYAYKSNSVLNKNIILISPTLFYNTKASIGRHYRTWGSGKIRGDNDKVPSANGPVYVSGKDFIVNDMVLSVTVHVSVGAPNIGPQILQSIKI